MAKRKSEKGDEPTKVDVTKPQENRGKLKAVGGSQSDPWNYTLATQALSVLLINNPDAELRKEQLDGNVAALKSIGPKDELEGMMAAQLIAAHNVAMECYRRAMIDEQTLEGLREYLNQANKLSRTWTTLLEALNKHRGKGGQKVTVEHVHVHAGGQAVVGAFKGAGNGKRANSEKQTSAEQNAHAPQPALRSPDTKKEAMPVARDGERPLPDAWGNLARRTDR